jgi:hypothetical protein
MEPLGKVPARAEPPPHTFNENADGRGLLDRALDKVKEAF